MKISRRAFCQTGSAAVAGSLFPGFPALGQATAAGRNVPAAVPAVKLDGTATSIEAAALRELAGSLDGQLLLDGDFGYDGARRIHDAITQIIAKYG